MSETPKAETPESATERSPAESARRRRLALLAGLAVVVVAVLVAVLLLTGGDDDEPGREAAATTSAAPATPPEQSSFPEPTPTTPSPGPTGDVNQPPPALPAVPLDARGEVGNGVSATLASIEAIDAEARGPGQIAGPALRFTVAIQNGTAEDIVLDSVSVNAYHGAEYTPASPLDDPSRSEFRGTLAAGGTAEGVYVFSVPADARDLVTLEVGYTAGAPLLVFSGPVA